MQLAAGPFGLGPMELVIILLVLVMLFGATRLTDIGGSLGKGIREFRKNIKEEEPEEEAAAPTEARASSNGAAETVAAVQCPSCGSLNPAGSRHCNQCGASLVASSVS